jgi:hypothetical protein
MWVRGAASDLETASYALMRTDRCSTIPVNLLQIQLSFETVFALLRFSASYRAQI